MPSTFLPSTKTLLSVLINSSVSLTTQPLFKPLQTLRSVHSCTLRTSSSSSLWQATPSSSSLTTYLLNIRRSSSEHESSQNAPIYRIKASNWLFQDQHNLSSTPLWLLCHKLSSKVKSYTPAQRLHWQLLSALIQKLVARLSKIFHFTLRSVRHSVKVMIVLWRCLTSSILPIQFVSVIVPMGTQKSAICVSKPSSVTRHVDLAQSRMMPQNAHHVYRLLDRWFTNLLLQV